MDHSLQSHKGRDPPGVRLRRAEATAESAARRSDKRTSLAVPNHPALLLLLLLAEQQRTTAHKLPGNIRQLLSVGTVPKLVLALDEQLLPLLLFPLLLSTTATRPTAFSSATTALPATGNKFNRENVCLKNGFRFYLDTAIIENQFSP